jgi:hypothetical protein
MKRQIEDVTVVAPVRAKNQQDALMFFCGFSLCFLDLGARVRIGRVEILVHVRRLFQVRRIGSFGVYQPPLLSLLLPALGVGHAHGLAPIRQARLHFGFEYNACGAGPFRHSDDSCATRPSFLPSRNQWNPVIGPEVNFLIY